MIQEELTVGHHCAENYKNRILRSTFAFVKGLIYQINYFSAPMVKSNQEQLLILESIRNKVWNPVFTIGAVSFFLSMTLRGFFDQQYAVFPLAVSTLVLFSGVWILSAHAEVVFDQNESKVFFVYKHFGYLQKIYIYPLTSIDAVQLIASNPSYASVRLLKDNGELIKIASQRNQEQQKMLAQTISSFLKIPLETA